MSPKRSDLNQKLTLLRQLTGRYASKYTPGGREKRITRTMPSLPKVRCLESTDCQEEPHGPKDAGLSAQNS